MSFYRERIIKKPHKQYVCDWCGKPITGEHLYISGMNTEGEFCTMRSHEKCQREMTDICNECPDKRYCFDSPRDCWDECHEKKGAGEMSEPKFTLGPWCKTPLQNTDDTYRLFSGTKIIGLVCNSDNSKEENEANAILISTAPDMYELLSALEFNLPPEYSDFSMEIINVLKKARGEQ